MSTNSSIAHTYYPESTYNTGAKYLDNINSQAKNIPHTTQDYLYENSPRIIRGDPDSASKIIVFTHERHGPEWTSQYSLDLIRVLQQHNKMTHSVTSHQLAFVFVFCSNPQGIITSTRHLGDGQDIMRGSPITRKQSFIDRIISYISQDPTYNDQSASQHHIINQQHQLIEQYLTQHKTIYHFDVHIDPTRLNHYALFSPTHVSGDITSLDQNKIDPLHHGLIRHDRNIQKAINLAWFYEQVRKQIHHHKLKLRGSVQHYVSQGDPIDYHVAKQIYTTSYQGTYYPLTYEIPSLQYLRKHLHSGGLFLPHSLRGGAKQLLVGQPIINRSLMYTIPTQDQQHVSTIYQSNIISLIEHLILPHKGM